MTINKEKSAPVFRQRRNPNRSDQPVPTSVMPVDEGTSSNDYAVGYGKPPEKHRFKPGQSGNPRGRPKGSRGVNTHVRKIMERSVKIRRDGRVRKVQAIEALPEKALEQAAAGNSRALMQLISMYRSAVPDVAEPIDFGPDERLASDSDAAILAAFEAKIIRKFKTNGGV